MFVYIFAVLVLAAGLYIIWKSWGDGTFNWWKGIGALAALIAAFLVMAADWLNSFAQ